MATRDPCAHAGWIVLDDVSKCPLCGLEKWLASSETSVVRAVRDAVQVIEAEERVSRDYRLTQILADARRLLARVETWMVANGK